MVVPPWQVFNGVWGRVAVGSSVLNWNFPSLRWKLDGLQCLISEAFILNSRLERQYSVINLCIKKKNSISAYYVNYLCVISASRAPTLSAGWVGYKTSPAIVRPVEGHNRAAPLLSAQDKLQWPPCYHFAPTHVHTYPHLVYICALFVALHKLSPTKWN